MSQSAVRPLRPSPGVPLMCESLRRLIQADLYAAVDPAARPPAHERDQPGGASRRALLSGAGATTVAGALLAAASPASATPPSATPVVDPGGSRARTRHHRTRLVLLGVAGGPVMRSTRYAGISTAVVYDGRVYIVDLGHSAPFQFAASGLYDLATSPFTVLRGLFFTHMHSDHLTEWPAFYMTAPQNVTSIRDPFQVQVFGPGDRGTLPRVYPEGRPAPPVINPERPTPGITGMTDGMRLAFAADFNDRMRDNNSYDPSRIFRTNDIDVSRYWTVDSAGIPPRLPAGEQIPVWVDGDVRVTATLVDHRPNAPAFGFRFDTPDGSVVVSGDTRPSDNLIDLAQGADYLVHEVIDEAYVRRLGANLDPAQREAMQQHLLEAHTTIEQVGPVAQAAGAKNLVLSHYVPSTSPKRVWMQAQRGYSGNVILGDDLLHLGVGNPRRPPRG